MAKSWLYRLIYLILVLLTFAGVQFLDRTWGTTWLRGPFANRCVKDPANLPSPPPGPDGKPSNYLYTCGSGIYDSEGREVQITGINWSGMEYSGYAPGGLGVRKWQEILDDVAGLGYNTIRIPFTNETLEPNRKIGNVNFALNPDLQDLTGLEMLDRIIDGARARGLKVILDRHKPTVNGYSPLWYNYDVPEARWIADWRMLAQRYLGNDAVIGFDLHNEPRDQATWGTGDLATDWRLAAERAGNAILEVNPYLLIFVEGVEYYGGDHSWWGANLEGVRKAPVRLNVPNRVVYSPHDYGPNISSQSWFWDPLFPSNLPQVWDRQWGYIHREGIAPVVLGEFGGLSVGNDPEGQWQRALLSFIKANHIGALIWSINPNWDTGGIFANDWQTIEMDKQKAYQQILAPPIDIGLGGAFGLAPTHLRLLFRQGQAAEQTQNVSFTFRIVNDSPSATQLSRIELRYWLKVGSKVDPKQQATIESSDPRAAYIQADLLPTDKGDQDHYIRVGFVPDADTIARYQTSNEITIRFPKTGWLDHDDSNDYSYASSSDFRDSFAEWDRVTLYLDGKLAWGQEP